MWVGEPSFLDKAHLSDMQLFVSPAASGGARASYLIMADLGGNFIANQAVEIRESMPLWRAWPVVRNFFKPRDDECVLRDVTFVYDEPSGGEPSSGAPPMPPTLTASLSISEATLTLYDSERVYAFLRKDYAASSAALAAFNE
jgi:hypothetical protein